MEEKEKPTHAFWGHQPVNRTPSASSAELTLADFAMPAGYRTQALSHAERDKWLPLVHTLLLHSDASSDEDEAEVSPFVALFNRAFLFGFNFKPSEAFHDYILTSSPMASFYLALFHGQPEEMVAFVAATELNLRIDDKQIRTVEVHSLVSHARSPFACIAPDHRGKRLVPPMLGSLYTQVLPHKIKQAVFSTAVPLPMCPVAQALHWGRPVNAELCVQAGYIQTQKTDNRDEIIAKFKLPATDLFGLLRPTTDEELPACLSLFHEHLKRYRMAPVMEMNEFRFRVMTHPPFLHCLTARAADDSISAFISLYILQSRWYTPRPTSVNVACLGYWAAQPSISLPSILTAALHCAGVLNCALLLATDIAGLGAHLPDLQFNPIKQSNLLYQVYNYQTSALDASQVALQFCKRRISAPIMSLLPATPLTDGVIRLRPWSDADIPWLVECMKDPEIPKWTRLSADFDEQKAKEYVARTTQFTQRLVFAIIDVATGVPLGSVGLGRVNVPPPYESEDCQPDELGYLVTKEARSRGIATRGALLVMDYAFAVLRRPSIHMTIKEGNGPSIRIAEKLKFAKTGAIVSSACGGTTSTILLFRREAPHIHRVPVEGLTDGVVRLRPWRDSDNAWVIECMKDEEISRWTRIPHPYTEEHAKQFAAMRAEWARWGHHVVLAIEDVKTGVLQGGVGLHRIDYPPPYEQVRLSAACLTQRQPDFLPNEMGYYLNKEARGKGVATRAGTLLCNFALDILKCPAINMGIKEGNARSLRLAERLGFGRVGTDRKVIGTGPESDIVLLRREPGAKKVAAE